VDLALQARLCQFVNVWSRLTPAVLQLCVSFKQQTHIQKHTQMQYE